MFAYLSLEIRRALRDRQYLALVVGWPVGAYLLFTAVFGSSPATGGLPVDTALMVAMATFGASGAVLIATGPRLALDRQSGWLRQMRLTPLSAQRLLVARLLAAMCLAVPAIVLTFATAALVHGVVLEAWRWPVLVGVLCLGCLPFAAIGLLIGTLADSDNAQGVTMVVYLTMSALGGVWMPLSIMPATLQTIAHLLPSNRMAELGWRVAAGNAPTIAAVTVLAAWLAGAAVLTVLSSYRFADSG